MNLSLSLALAHCAVNGYKITEATLLEVGYTQISRACLLNFCSTQDALDIILKRVSSI